MYPLKFENIYFEKIWGGRDFEKFRANLPKGNIGESWDIACHTNGTGIVKNGLLKGKTLRELMDSNRIEVFGENFKEEEFPLLIKLINSSDDLSVQVHPGDDYARINENSFGKTECWYVVDATEEASLVIGTKDCTKEEFEKAINDGKTEECLNRIPVKKGDFFFVPSGMVHAICKGVIVAEIQQNSDITYRVYDYGRPREIHVEKALDVIDFTLKAEELDGREYKVNNTVVKELCNCEYFSVNKIEIVDEYSVIKDTEFYMYTCVEGSAKILGEDFEEEINLGDSILIPASLKNYSIVGKVKLLKSTSK